MQYKVLSINDDNTATVEMKIGDRVLNQNFALGENVDELKATIAKGMAVFKCEIDAKAEVSADDSYDNLVDKTQELSELPKIPPEDNEPEQSLEPEKDDPEDIKE